MALAATLLTIDLDPTTVEVDGRMKAGSAFNNEHEHSYRPPRQSNPIIRNGSMSQTDRYSRISV